MSQETAEQVEASLKKARTTLEVTDKSGKTIYRPKPPTANTVTKGVWTYKIKQESA